MASAAEPDEVVEKAEEVKMVTPTQQQHQAEQHEEQHELEDSPPPATTTRKELEPEDDGQESGEEVVVRLPVDAQELEAQQNTIVELDQTPVHPIALMQGAFEESIMESTELLNDGQGARQNMTNAEERRRQLLQGEDDFDPSVSRWQQPPTARFHPVWKLVAQIIFGVHLLHQHLAKSDDEVVKILQTHVDEIDSFIENVTADFDLAILDIERRVKYMQCPLENLETFDQMLDDRAYRQAIIEGNDRIELVIRRTARDMNEGVLDITKGLEASTELARYLEALGDQRQQGNFHLADVYDAMHGNAEGWYHALYVLHTKGNKLSAALVDLGGVIAEVSKRVGIASRRGLLKKQAQIPRDSIAARMSSPPPISRFSSNATANKPLPRTPAVARVTSVRATSSRPSTAPVAAPAPAPVAAPVEVPGDLSSKDPLNKPPVRFSDQVASKRTGRSRSSRSTPNRTPRGPSPRRSRTVHDPSSEKVLVNSPAKSPTSPRRFLSLPRRHHSADATVHRAPKPSPERADSKEPIAPIIVEQPNEPLEQHDSGYSIPAIEATEARAAKRRTNDSFISPPPSLLQRASTVPNIHTLSYPVSPISTIDEAGRQALHEPAQRTPESDSSRQRSVKERPATPLGLFPSVKGHSRETSNTHSAPRTNSRTESHRSPTSPPQAAPLHQQQQDQRSPIVIKSPKTQAKEKYRRFYRGGPNQSAEHTRTSTAPMPPPPPIPTQAKKSEDGISALPVMSNEKFVPLSPQKGSGHIRRRSSMAVLKNLFRSSRASGVV